MNDRGHILDDVELYDVLMRFIGPVDPIGSSHVDAVRAENLRMMLKLTDKLLTKIDNIATDNKNRIEYSMKWVENFTKEGV